MCTSEGTSTSSALHPIHLHSWTRQPDSLTARLRVPETARPQDSRQVQLLSIYPRPDMALNYLHLLKILNFFSNDSCISTLNC